MINKMITYKVKKDAIDEAQTLVREFVEHIKLNEEGTLLYRAHQHKGDKSRFVHFMSFEDEYAEEQHSSSNYCEEFVASLLPLCDEKPVYSELDRLAFHD